MGTGQDKPHITCELQNAKAWMKKFNQSIGKTISVNGFFRCMFEHPGFRRNDDAHIFEIHPVRGVTMDNQLIPFDVDIPDQDAIHTWTDPHPLNDQDKRIKVKYDKPNDTLTFSNMIGQDENYVKVSGTVSNINLNLSNSDLPASYTLRSKEVARPLDVYCLQGTTAALQLRQLNKKNITMIALRNIDLEQAFRDKYVINLLGIDIQES